MQRRARTLQTRLFLNTSLQFFSRHINENIHILRHLSYYAEKNTDLDTQTYHLHSVTHTHISTTRKEQKTGQWKLFQGAREALRHKQGLGRPYATITITQHNLITQLSNPHHYTAGKKNNIQKDLKLSTKFSKRKIKAPF